MNAKRFGLMGWVIGAALLCWAAPAGATDIVARLELDKHVTDFIQGFYNSSFAPVHAWLVIENQADRKQTITLKREYPFSLIKTGPPGPADLQYPLTAKGVLKSVFSETTITLVLAPHTQQAIAYGKIPGEGFAFTTYKGYSFPENYIIEVELPDGLPNALPGSKTQTMLIVEELVP